MTLNGPLAEKIEGSKRENFEGFALVEMMREEKKAHRNIDHLDAASK